MIAERRWIKRVRFPTTVALAMALGVCVGWAIPAFCDPQPVGFCDPNAKGGDFAHCVTRSIAQAPRGKSLSEILSDEPIRGYLQTLANKSGYHGEGGDLDVLKHFSADLKTDPNGNREVIAALDDAIASYAGEIRTEVSLTQLAATEEPGTDIYPLFIRQRLHFLGSEGVKFYDKGPFEIIVRNLLASTLESQFFLDRENGILDVAKLEREVAVLSEILERRDRPELQYLASEQSKSAKNSDNFWRAGLLFVLDRKQDLQDVLRDLVNANSDFAIEPWNAGQIYIYRVFNFPFKIVLQGGHDENGSPRISTTDPALLQRFYNAAQLALFTCSLLDNSGLGGISKFVNTISDMPLNDYFVVAATGGDYRTLETLSQTMEHAIDHDLHDKKLNYLGKIKYEENIETVEAMKRGERACGIDQGIGKKVYSGFEFKSKIIKLKTRPDKNYQLIFGGNVNVVQAREISNFLNQEVFVMPDMTAMRSSLGIAEGAYVARTRIEEVESGEAARRD